MNELCYDKVWYLRKPLTRAYDDAKLQHILQHTLQHPATHCNTLQHTATHCYDGHRRMHESCHTYEWVMSHMNESCHIWMSHVTYEWVISHMNESCHIWRSHVTYEWVMSYIGEVSIEEGQRHGVERRVFWCRLRWQMSRHTWMSHVINESVRSHMIGHVIYRWGICWRGAMSRCWKKAISMRIRLPIKTRMPLP